MQVLLNNQGVKENPGHVLKRLKLPLNFYELHNKNPAENSIFFQNLNDIGEKLLRRFSVFRVLYDFFKSKRPIYSLLPDNPSEDLGKRMIEIELPDDSIHKTSINKFTKAMDLCHEISQKIGLVSWLDYKLVLEKGQVEERFLDDDEFVFKAINIEEITLENPLLDKKQSFFEKLSEQFQLTQCKIKEIFRPNYKIKFKKSIFPHPFIERTDYMRDTVRLRMIACQSFKDIYTNKLDLSLNDFCFFGALYAFINYGSLMELKDEVFPDFLEQKVFQKVIPEIILVQEEKAVWVSNLMIFWDLISKEIVKIVECNKFFNESLEENIMTSMMLSEPLQPVDKSQQFKFKISDQRTLAEMVTLRYFMTSDMYGTHTYMILFRKGQKKEDDPTSAKQKARIFLTYQSLKIFPDSSSSQEIVYLKNIENLTVFPDHLEVQMSKKGNNDVLIYEIYSSESIHIYRIVELYLEIGRLSGDLKKKYVKKLNEDVKKGK